MAHKWPATNAVFNKFIVCRMVFIASKSRPKSHSGSVCIDFSNVCALFGDFLFGVFSCSHPLLAHFTGPYAECIEWNK